MSMSKQETSEKICATYQSLAGIYPEGGLRLKVHTTETKLVCNRVSPPSSIHCFSLRSVWLMWLVDKGTSSIRTCVLVGEDTAMLLQYGWQHLPGNNKGRGVWEGRHGMVCGKRRREGKGKTLASQQLEAYKQARVQKKCLIYSEATDIHCWHRLHQRSCAHIYFVLVHIDLSSGALNDGYSVSACIKDSF